MGTYICAHIYVHTYMCTHAGPLFTDSLKAEMAKHPELPKLTPADGDADPPEILFSSRRKGYFKTPHLCRVYVLQVLRFLRRRGEFFVVWKDCNGSYDGRCTLAHAATIMYCSIHQPGMSVVFDEDGALKSTSQIFKSIRRCMY